MPIPVRILPRAQSDVDHILDWMINERLSPDGAAAWFRAYRCHMTKFGPADCGVTSSRFS